MTSTRASLMAALALFAHGCAVHGQASARAQAAPGHASQVRVQGSAETKLDSGKARGSISIVFDNGALQYNGGVIEFDYNQAVLQGDKTEQTLRALLGYLDKHPDVSVAVEGHTDSRGSEQYNLDLSKRRASAIRDWLVAHGVHEDRLSVESFGEKGAERREPEDCYNKLPDGQQTCEKAWAGSRRAVFRVTQGAETLTTPPAPPQVAQKPAPPVEPKHSCAVLMGPRVLVGGPRSKLGAAFVVRPTCHLELSVGAGYDWGDISAATSDGLASASGSYDVWSVPVRARVWVLNRDLSPIIGLGVGVTKYHVSADGTFANAGMSYSREGTPLFGSLGVGAGYHPSGPWHLAALVGLLKQVGGLNRFDGSHDPLFPTASADDLALALDNQSDDLVSGIRGYFEVSVSLMF